MYWAIPKKIGVQWNDQSLIRSELIRHSNLQFKLIIAGILVDYINISGRVNQEILYSSIDFHLANQILFLIYWHMRSINYYQKRCLEFNTTTIQHNYYNKICMKQLWRWSRWFIGFNLWAFSYLRKSFIRRTVKMLPPEQCSEYNT